MRLDRERHVRPRKNGMLLSKRPELDAEPASALLDPSSANELVDGLLATAGASPLADLELTPNPGSETAALQGAGPNKIPELNAEPSSALQDHSATNELVDELLAKSTTAGTQSNHCLWQI
jgi:hypothetical protein